MGCEGVRSWGWGHGGGVIRGRGHEHSFCLVSAVVSSLLSVFRWVLYSLLSAERQYCRIGRSSCPTSKISWSSFVNLEWKKREGRGGGPHNMAGKEANS